MDEFNATPEAGSGHGGNGHLPTVAGESFNDPSLLTPIRRQDRDIRRSAKGLPKGQARFLVDNYYIMQRDRIRAAHQMRTLLDGGEPNDVLNWLFVQHDTLETRVKAALDTYSTSTLAGQWMRSITGIGPVMTAGLLCHINVEIAQTAGAVWRFAGLDPTQKWEKGTKRPWNGALKRLCYLIGDSFVKTKGSEKTHYGPVYEGRKAYEMRHNLAGVYAETASASLEAKRFGDQTEAKKHYKAGRLPPARIHLRAARYAVKLFLSHMHAVMTFCETERLPRAPWIMDRDGHYHMIAPPNMHLIPGMEAAWREFVGAEFETISLRQHERRLRMMLTSPRIWVGDDDRIVYEAVADATNGVIDAATIGTATGFDEGRVTSAIDVLFAKGLIQVDGSATLRPGDEDDGEGERVLSYTVTKPQEASEPIQ